MRHRVFFLVCALLLTLATAGAAAASATSRVPQGFAGVVIDGPLWPAPASTFSPQLDLMVASGVESVRADFQWARMQPYRSWSDVPAADRARFTDANGLPVDFAETDALVAACTQRGLHVQPLVLDAPGWDATAPAVSYAMANTPIHDAPYGAFFAALIGRYGPHGSFWRTGRPRAPIRSWQVWNEPNLPGFWSHQPTWAPSYAALLATAHAAIKAADPGAQVVAAGLPNASWKDMAKLLRVPGASRNFDLAAVHPYTTHPAGVITILQFVRTALDRGGARGRPIEVDEFGWNSSQGHHSTHHFGAETTEHGQATALGQAIPLLAGARGRLRLAGFDYYDWSRVETDGADEFAFAGLLKDVDGVFRPKPALAAYRRATLKLERCARKGSDARRCLRAA